jgi:hypothetical protein
MRTSGKSESFAYAVGRIAEEVNGLLKGHKFSLACGEEREVARTSYEVGKESERKEIVGLLTGVVAGLVTGPTGRRTGSIGREIGTIGGGSTALGRGAGSISIGRGA